MSYRFVRSVCVLSRTRDVDGVPAIRGCSIANRGSVETASLCHRDEGGQPGSEDEASGALAFGEG